MRTFKVGDLVTSSLEIAWGNVPAGTVGEVVSLEQYGTKCVVSFPVKNPCELYQRHLVRFDNPTGLLKLVERPEKPNRRTERA
jgi:hypothetical protein